MTDLSNLAVPTQIGPYTIRGTVGEGAFSIVKVCYHTDERHYYACKIVPKSLLLERELLDRFKLEIDIHRGLCHPGIITTVDLIQDIQNFYLILEFCPNGELFQYIVEREKLTEDEAKVYLLQILDALNYIHQKDIIHRDLKPENILFDQFGRLKIGDFGLSHFSAIGNLVNTPCGSPCYASPELLSGHPYDGRTNDIWSVGVILFAMVTGQLPWTKRNQIELFNQIRRGEYRIPPFLSGNCSNLIQRLLTVNPSERITLSQALKHPFLANVQLVQTPTGTVRRMSQEVVERAFGKPKVTSRQAVVAPTKVKGKGVSPKAAKPPVIAKFHGHKRPLTAPSGAGKK